MTIIHSQILTLSTLTSVQAHSKDGKGRTGIQGFLGRTVEGKGKKQRTVVREFSALRPDKGQKAGKYAFDGTLVLMLDEKPSKTHEVNGVVYERYNARIVGGEVKAFERLPDDFKGSAMPF